MQLKKKEKKKAAYEKQMIETYSYLDGKCEYNISITFLEVLVV